MNKNEIKKAIKNAMKLFEKDYKSLVIDTRKFETIIASAIVVTNCGLVYQYTFFEDKTFCADLLSRDIRRQSMFHELDLQRYINK